MSRTGEVGPSHGQQGPQEPGKFKPASFKHAVNQTNGTAINFLEKTARTQMSVGASKDQRQVSSRFPRPVKPTEAPATSRAASRPLGLGLTPTSPKVAKPKAAGLEALKGKGLYLVGITKNMQGTPFSINFEAETDAPDDTNQVGQRVFGGNEGILKQLKLPRAKNHKPH